MKYEPLHNYLLLAPERSKEKTSGGIIIPDNYRTNLTQGVIEKMGEGAIHPSLSVGDTVLFRQNTDYRMTLDGEEKILVSLDDVILYGKGNESDRSSS